MNNIYLNKIKFVRSFIQKEELIKALKIFVIILNLFIDLIHSVK